MAVRRSISLVSGLLQDLELSDAYDFFQNTTITPFSKG
jgi:hypothetical protein